MIFTFSLKYPTFVKNKLMKTALFLGHEELDYIDIDKMPIIVLHTENKCIKKVEKSIIVKKNINYLSLWLLTNRISEVYVMDIAPPIKELFERIGVVVKKHTEISNNLLLKEIREE